MNVTTTDVPDTQQIQRTLVQMRERKFGCGNATTSGADLAVLTNKQPIMNIETTVKRFLDYYESYNICACVHDFMRSGVFVYVSID